MRVHHPELSDMIFDPDQDPEEKRAVRQNYRSLAKKIEGMRIICYPFYNIIIWKIKGAQMILQQRNSCRKFKRRTSYSIGVIKLFYQSFLHIS